MNKRIQQNLLRGAHVVTVGMLAIGALCLRSPYYVREEVEPTPTPTPVVEAPVETPQPIVYTAPIIIPQITIVVPELVAEEPEEVQLDPVDVEMMACVIYQEAGGNAACDDARLAVGCVVLNRVAHPLFPDTIEEVLTAPWQYGTFCQTGIVWPARAAYETEAEAVARAYQCAERVLRGETPNIEGWSSDIVWQAEFKQGTETVVYLDGHYFCK